MTEGYLSRRGGKTGFSLFHWEGPRNWFGAAPKGAWSGGFGDMDDIEVPFTMMVGFIAFLWLATQIGFSLIGLAYIAMILASFIGYVANFINKDIPTEYLGSGNKKDFWTYARVGLIAVFGWLILYFILGVYLTGGSTSTQGIMSVLSLQEVALPRTIPTTLFGLLALGFIQIVLIAQVEGSFLGGWVLPSLASKVGVIPAIAITSVFTGLFHLVTMNAVPVHVLMSVMFGVLTYPLVLAYRSKEPTIVAHYVANFVAFFLPILLSSGIIAS